MNLARINKYSQVALKKIMSQLRTWIFLRTGFFLPRPMKVYYLLTNKCNYQCKMCPQWGCGSKENPEDYMSTEEMKKIVDEMVELGIKEFGVSGGEALIYREKMFALLEYANSNGLYTHFVTNGKLLTKEVLERYDSIGGGHVSLSIDGIGERHDYLRGAPGAFHAIQDALKVWREHKFPNILLKINTVLSGGNLDQVLKVVQLAIDNGAVIFIQPYDVYDFAPKLTAHEKQTNFDLWVKEEQYPLLRQVLDELIKLKKKYPQIILNDVRHLRKMYDYFVKCDINHTCFAALDEVALTPFGRVTFCKFGEYFDVRHEGLKKFVKSKKRREVIQESLKCRQGCLLACMFRPSVGEMLVNGPKQFFKLIKSR